MNELVQGFRSYLVSEADARGGTVKRYVESSRLSGSLLRAHGSETIALEAVKKVELSKFLRRCRRRAVILARPSSICVLAALRSFYDQLFKQEVIDGEPALRIDRLRVTAASGSPLSFDEVLALVEAVRKHFTAGLRSRNVASYRSFLPLRSSRR